MIFRNAGARYWVPSEDEWVKAAYYKGGGTNAGYWDFPTSTSAVPNNDLVHPDPGNHATFYQNDYTLDNPPYYRTEAGEFDNSASPYGTFDQAGNVSEWNEEIVTQGVDVAYRGLRGGSFLDGALTMIQNNRDFEYLPTRESPYIGFRIAGQAVPEPATLGLLAIGGLGVIGRMIGRRRQG